MSVESTVSETGCEIVPAVKYVVIWYSTSAGSLGRAWPPVPQRIAAEAKTLIADFTSGDAGSS